MSTKSRRQRQTIPLHIIQRSDNRKTVFPYRLINRTCVRYGLTQQSSKLAIV